MANAASQRLVRDSEIVTLVWRRRYKMAIMAEVSRIAASQPIKEWVIVLCPNFRSSGLEMKGKRRPMNDLGMSMSGIKEPMIANRITVQCRLYFMPKTANVVRVRKMPKIEWVGASILSHPKHKEPQNQ